MVTGRVVDAITGQPVRAAEISAGSASHDGTQTSEPRSVLADIEGRFVIDQLMPGRYVLQASREGYLSPDRVSGPGFKIVVVAAGQHVEDVIISLMPGGVITGRLSDENGVPLARASVQAMRYRYHEGKAELEEAASASTTDRGEYRIEGLMPARYFLRATALPTRTLAGKDSTARVPLYYPNASNLNHATQLDVRAGEELSGIDMRFAPVRVFEINGTVGDARAGAPAAGVEVTLLGDGGYSVFSSGQTTTDAHGKFRFSGIPEGSYVVVAQLSTGNENSSAWGHTSVEVVDKNVEDVEVMVGPGSTVRGRIRVEGGDKIYLGNLKGVLESRGSMMLSSMMPTVEPTLVNTDGSFAFHHVPEGSYNVRFMGVPAGHYLRERENLGVLETGLNVGMGAATPRLDFLLSSTSASVEGTVIGDGPVANALVVIVPESRRRSQADYYQTSVSNRVGRFTIRGIAPGDYRLFASERISADTFMDPDFLREHEDRGQLIHLEENGRASVEVPLMVENTSR